MLVLSLLHVASRLLSCFVAVLPMPIGKTAKPFIFECLKRGYKVVLRGRHGILWDSDVFEKVLPVVLCDRRRRAWNVTFRGFQFGKMNWWTDDELTMNWRNWLESNYVKLDARRKTLPHPRVPATTPFFGPRLPPPSTPAATCFKQPLTEASEQIRTAWKNRSMFKQNLIILDSWFMLIHVDSCWFMLIHVDSLEPTKLSADLHFIGFHWNLVALRYVAHHCTMQPASGLWALGPRKDWTTAILSSRSMCNSIGTVLPSTSYMYNICIILYIYILYNVLYLNPRSVYNITHAYTYNHIHTYTYTDIYIQSHTYT